ncbi:ABC transporter ATP-binding protein [Vagococcus xieshaowenii]|uniref:ABC transporter ATP-binding protein n=1 Tax=Vagococcus xieshaowenii TaxID=2562451 RepID=A0AAJ5EDH2_9ENTE|nr:ABC transporter ATP-binding protein [Vagococcus xieshaowenii]QCA28144.1 ABC transporter ATP-binding protein [Vagococcus xieshaowenii]TFZ39730.1 ABC transporter ATP-binding protein [Vagococcus xieshaowenii]
MIDIQGVSVRYGNHQILDDISFQLDDDEIVCVLGPNGSGKTTLLKTILNLVPFSGEILINGQSVKKYPRKTLAKEVALLSQHQVVQRGYTVQDIVLMGRFRYQQTGLFNGYSKVDFDYVDTLLADLGLWELKEQEVVKLSGGQKQLVFLAKIMAQNPRLLLLDEPSNHLDIKYQLEMIAFLKQWRDQRESGILGVFHDVNLALHLSDHLLMLKEGRILAKGSFSEIGTITNFQTLYETQLVEYYLASLEKWQQLLK